MSDCVFCDIVLGLAPATVVARWDQAIAIEPLNPVTEGHILVIPHRHVRDASVDPMLTGRMFEYAATRVPNQACNLITSCGSQATQTVFHLHVHVVPRRPCDGLLLPWSDPLAERGIV